MSVLSDQIHQHCAFCIKVKVCRQYDKCNVIKCINGCGFTFHQCKLEEHKLLCKKEKVSCINAGNGCPIIMLRSETAKHLETCPASVIVCTNHWSRQKAQVGHQMKYFSYQKLGHGQLDADLLLSDHRKVCDSLGFPDVRAHIPETPSNVSEIPVLCQDNSKTVNHKKKSDSSDIYGFNDTDGSYWWRTFEENIHLPNPKPPALIVGLTIDFAGNPKHTVGKNGVRSSYEKWSFSCVEEFRRDQYVWHFKNVHNDILCGLNGWMEYRCPLLQYGCGYSVRRLHPYHKGVFVVYNEELESFGIQYSENEMQCSSGQVSHLTELPFEVLSYLCMFLDSFSLCNLAVTCRRLRSVCFSLLKQRGLVIQVWKKCKVGDQIVWRISVKRWCFSKAFSPVNNWSFGVDEHMSNHLQQCKYNQRKQFEEKYYRVLPDRLSVAGPSANMNKPVGNKFHLQL